MLCRSDVVEAETSVEGYLESVEPEIAEKLARYKRQYSGVLKDGRKLIYLNFFIACGGFDTDWGTRRTRTTLDNLPSAPGASR